MARPGCAPGANTTFQHEPLPSATCIRLLRIQPDLVDGAIACTLQHHFPDGPSPCPGYVALSYEWGDPTPRHDILVNGRPRRVHAGLWDFLDWARRTTAGGGRSSSGRGCSSSSLWWWWWTDSLCLDQANREELSAQVARMGDIYAGARSVTIWLGRDRAVEEALGEWSARGARCDEVGIHYMKRLISNSYWGRVVSGPNLPPPPPNHHASSPAFTSISVPNMNLPLAWPVTYQPASLLPSGSLKR